MNLDEVLDEKGLKKILKKEKWRVEKMMKLKRNGVEKEWLKLEKMNEACRLLSPILKRSLETSRHKEISFFFRYFQTFGVIAQ